jgi:hypothetical protein
MQGRNISCEEEVYSIARNQGSPRSSKVYKSDQQQQQKRNEKPGNLGETFRIVSRVSCACARCVARGFVLFVVAAPTVDTRSLPSKFKIQKQCCKSIESVARPWYETILLYNKELFYSKSPADILSA